MKKIAVFGAGGFGKEVMMLIEQINATNQTWHILGFYDDGIKKGTVINQYEVLGGVNDLNAITEEVSVVIAIGDSGIRANVKSQLNSSFINFPILIHPNVLIGNYVTIGEGTIITANNILTININVGKFVILNLACTVGHDAVLEDFTSFMPSVNISGGVIVREGVYVGTGAQILNHLEIGAHTKIGAGAVVKESLPANCTAVGVPAITVRYHDNKN
ncbi:sugar O-acyltransferase (sialic acid O-acetyltransferase NeuD family) [Pontibacter aydingkolensis]|uniref:Acetyltransferase n=1 Tax=Pontibacter aydingkolensis TaxID=1911536 RepID=A0ABS7CV38_9BACT|nr:acetyltransferase [Pontibacter aydingkolensis]MBW7467660.1 acetyltransferase [Pontibacter aydingkolensis]